MRVKTRNLGGVGGDSHIQSRLRTAAERPPSRPINPIDHPLVYCVSFRAFPSIFCIVFDELNDLYQQVILDHCKHPRNFRELPNPTRFAQGHNPLCGDQLRLFLAMDGDVVKDISFLGSGCCISKASASLLTEAAKGKTRAEIEKMFELVHEMVTTGRVIGDVGKLAVFAGVYKFPARVKCAILAWHAAMAALKGDNLPVTTETEDT